MSTRESRTSRLAGATVPRKLLLVAVLSVLGVCSFAAPAQSHDFRPGALTIVELEPGEYLYSYEPPVDSRGETAVLGLEFPEHCTLRHDAAMSVGARTYLSCGSRGLSGVLRLSGDYDPRVRIIVTIRRSGAPDEQRVLRGADKVLDLQSPPSGLLAWIAIGFEHVLTGYDHLAFIAGLLLLIGWGGPVLATLTAFTVAHSLTLGLSALNVAKPPAAPVEALIALSVVLLAREAAQASADRVSPESTAASRSGELQPSARNGARATEDREGSAARRQPWLLAGGFGLVHGLGFAGALEELSLGGAELRSALLGFNLGVELGQITVVAAAALLLWPLRAVAWRASAHWLLCCVLGGLASYWFLCRIALLAAA